MCVGLHGMIGSGASGNSARGHSRPVSYGTCGDEDQYAARVSGTLSQSPKRTFALPGDGEVLVETSKKHVRVRFEEKFWRLGLAEVKVNDDEPVVIPVIH